MEFIERAKEILGPGGWLPPEDGPGHLSDVYGPGGAALLIARPGSTGALADLVALCAGQGVAIVPQGGNTNLCRMAVPTEPRATVVVSLSRMARVIEVNTAAATLTVEAGCTIAAAQEAAAAHGLVFAPDWGARGTATVGGAVATNGGGLNVLRYGTTREQVLGVEVVLPDGRVWNGLRALIKDNSGYDLKQLFIGSEGTLGLITRLVFRLHPAQPVSQSMMAVPSDMFRLMELFALAREVGGARLTAFELMPGIGVEKALEKYPTLSRPLETRSDWYLLIRFSDRASVSDALAVLFEKAFEAGLVSDAVMAGSGAQEANLWALREQMIPIQYFDGAMLKWDVSVPIDRIAAFLDAALPAVRDLAPDAVPYAAGHVGDGNIHFAAFLPDDARLPDRRRALYDRIDALIWELGGSIVAEHGVGALFRDRLRGQKDTIEIDLMHRVKAALDPLSLMNPGKLLPWQEDQAAACEGTPSASSASPAG